MLRLNRPVLGHGIRLEDRLAPAIVSFALVQAQSNVTLSGTVAGFPITQQGTGSLTTSYTGAVQVDLDLANNLITFMPSQEAVAQNTGNWQPLPGGNTGSAPADYGGRVVALGAVFAIRDLRAAASTAAALTMAGTGATRTFPSTQIATTVTNGSLDYNAGILGTGTNSLIGSSGTNDAGTADGSFIDLMDGTARLTNPVNASFMTTLSGQPVIYHFAGQFVAVTPFPIADLNGAAVGADTMLNFIGGAAATAIAPSALVLRNPATTLNSMTIVLTNRPDGGNESLALNPGGLTSSGYDPSTGTLTLSGPGSLAAYEAALRTVTYRDSLSSATPGNRVITVVVNDGTISSLPHTATVNVTANGPIPSVTSTQINDGSAQRSRVTRLQVTFNTQVSFAGAVGDAFTLVRTGGGSVSFQASASVIGGVTVVTLNNFTGTETDGFGSLNDGRYTLTVLASQISANGQQMASNYTFGDTQGLFRLFGDVNGDQTVNGFDLGFFRSAFGTQTGDSNYLSYLDINGDGVINGFDLGQFRTRFGTMLP
jgi:hypothetical protein